LSDSETQERDSKHTVLNSRCFDVIVVGAGVVGCAVARRFTLEGAHVAVIEKATDILDGASKANSAILHTGFDAPADSLELSCIRDGYREYREIRTQIGLPLDQVGALVVAWTDQETATLDSIVSQAHDNGVDDVHLVNDREIFRREPNLAKDVRAAIAVPGESIIDPWSAPYAYLRQALMNGAQIFLSCELTGGDYGGGEWLLQTSRGTLKARYVINCAGLFGDTVDGRLLGTSNFNIVPRKGQFVVFDKAAASLVKSIVLPVPTARTKGIVVCRTVFGNVLVGPTAEDQPNREDASTDKRVLKDLIDAGMKKFPGLKDIPITATYAGLRPASEYKDYQIHAKPNLGWITVGAIRSTGLSGALGIAQYVYGLYARSSARHSPIVGPEIPLATSLAQSGERDWQRQDHGEIVCHCELVTEREIGRALTGPLAARSLSGLKRQTRVTMGRCQGVYCSARLAELTDGHFDSPLSHKFADG
jgi:glycerol-3-phosphate dehydrogenase